LLGSAIAAGVIADRRALEKFAHDLSENSRVYVGEDRALWMDVKTSSGARKVGTTARNIFAPGSDRELATKLMLFRIDAVLRERKAYREALPQFATSWGLLENALRETVADSKGADAGVGVSRPAPGGTSANLRP
jgi:hypothetical protein